MRITIEGDTTTAIEADSVVGAILALAARLTPARLGRLRRDDLHAIQREMRGVRVTLPPPKDEEEKDHAHAESKDR